MNGDRTRIHSRFVFLCVHFLAYTQAVVAQTPDRATFFEIIQSLQANTWKPAQFQKLFDYDFGSIQKFWTKDQTADRATDIEAIQATAKHVFEDLAFSNTNHKPQDISNEAWIAAKSQLVQWARTVMAGAPRFSGDYQKAEDGLVGELQRDPTNSLAAFELGAALLEQQAPNPQKLPRALFAYARAAYYEGPGMLPSQKLERTRTFIGKAYNVYHGSAEGLAELIALAKQTALPPEGFRIAANIDFVAVPDDRPRRNPDLWVDLRDTLTSDSTGNYWRALEGASAPGGVNGQKTFYGQTCFRHARSESR
ncbi:MAG: hypothetical protein ABL967_02770 [Bryobacteraceae bacterium]